jgi:uncharacterized protein (DUF2164 family)
MNQPETKILTEIKRIEQAASDTLQSVSISDGSMNGEDLSEVAAWVTQLGQLVRSLYGERSEQYATFTRAIETQNFYSLHSNWNSHIAVLLGLAKVVTHDLEQGLLQDVRSLIQAEVFSDFLEMGEYLLSEGYKDAAAVILGAVLEDTLRKLAIKHSISLTTQSGKSLTIDPINAALAGVQAYSKLIQKQITTWAHLRNKAAHGQYSEYNKEQVEMMLIFVQSFCSDYLK